MFGSNRTWGLVLSRLHRFCPARTLAAPATVITVDRLRRGL